MRYLFFLLAIICLAPISESQSEAYRVFVPVDDSNQPVGEYVWIPRSLYEIVSSTQIKNEQLYQNWKIHSAQYQTSFAQNSLTQNLSLVSFKAIYVVEIQASSVTLCFPMLPVSADGAKIMRLDDEEQQFEVIHPISEAFTEANLLFRLENQKIGLYRLELNLTPTIEYVESTAKIELPIPKVADSNLEILLPPESPAFSIPSALGAVFTQSGQLTAELGPNDKLILCWNEKNAQATVEADQIFWLRIRPNQVDVRALYRFRVSGGKIQNLSIVNDPYLQLSGLYRCEEAELLSESGEQNVGNQGGQTHLAFQKPVDGNITIRADYIYVVPGSAGRFPGIGRILPPEIKLQNVNVVNKWMAISCDPLLECIYPTSTLPVDKFRQNWAATDETLLAAFDLTKTEPNSSISIQAKEPIIKVEESLSVLLSTSNTSFLSEQKIDSLGDTYQLHFQMPDFVSIDSIEIRDSENRVLDCRWTRENEHSEQNATFVKTSIFFRRPLGGINTIFLRGHFPSDLGTSVSVPSIRIKSAKYNSRYLHLYRVQSVVADLPFLEYPWEPIHAVPSAPLDSMSLDFREGIYFLSLQDMHPEIEQILTCPSIVLEQNALSVSGRQLFVLNKKMDADSWQLDSHFQLSVTNGLLDSIRVNIDPQYADSLSLSPDSPFTIERMTQSRFPVLKPKFPMTGNVDFTLTISPQGNKDSVSLPTIFLESLPELETYVSLSQDYAGASLHWRTKNLEEIHDEPTETWILGVLGAPNSTNWKDDLLFFKAKGADFSAMISPQSAPSVFLCDVSLYFRKTGHLYGLISYELINVEQEFLELIMPDSYEMIHLTSGNIVEMPKRLDDGKIRVPLMKHPFPQKIEFVFSGTLDYVFSPGSNATVINLPHLNGLKSALTLWIAHFDNPFLASRTQYRAEAFDVPGVKSLTGAMRPPAFSSDIPANLFLANLARLEAKMDALETVATNFPHVLRSDLANWYSLWGRDTAKLFCETDNLNSMLAQQIKMDSELVDKSIAVSFFNKPPNPSSILALALRRAECAEKLGLSQLDQQIEISLGELPVHVFPIWKTNIQDNSCLLYGVTNTPTNTIVIQAVPNPWSLWESGLLLYIMLFFVICFGVMLWQRLHAYHFFSQYAFFCGTTVGVVFWAVLGLNILGAVVLLLTFLSAIWTANLRKKRLYNNWQV